MRMLYTMLGKVLTQVLGPSGIGLPDIALGEGLFETSLTDNFSEALDHLNVGLNQAEADGDTEVRFAGHGLMCRILTAQGGRENALKLLDGFETKLTEKASHRLRKNVDALRIRLDMLGGNTLRPRQWMDDRAPDELSRFNILERYGFMTKARGYIMQSRFTEAGYLLGRMRAYFTQYQRPYGQAESELLLAVMYHRMRREDWREHFDAALSICEKYGLVRLMADEGIAICDMAVEKIPQDTPYHIALLARIQQQARLYPKYLQPFNGDTSLLTETEHAVYQMVIIGRRNEEIAAVLGITLRTVKFHTGNIYRKLGVINRAQVIKRAAELGDL